MNNLLNIKIINAKNVSTSVINTNLTDAVSTYFMDVFAKDCLQNKSKTLNSSDVQFFRRKNSTTVGSVLNKSF